MSATSNRVGVAAILLVCLLLPACKSKVTPANFEKIKEGMTLAEVEKILGKGTKDEGGDGSNVAGQFGVAVQPAATVGGKGAETYNWDSGTKQITVVFREGKVISKRSSGM